MRSLRFRVNLGNWSDIQKLEKSRPLAGFEPRTRPDRPGPAILAIFGTSTWTDPDRLSVQFDRRLLRWSRPEAFFQLQYTGFNSEFDGGRKNRKSHPILP